MTTAIGMFLLSGPMSTMQALPNIIVCVVALFLCIMQDICIINYIHTVIDEKIGSVEE